MKGIIRENTNLNLRVSVLSIVILTMRESKELEIN
jgi:hypothetical protein